MKPFKGREAGDGRATHKPSYDSEDGRNQKLRNAMRRPCGGLWFSRLEPMILGRLRFRRLLTRGENVVLVIKHGKLLWLRIVGKNPVADILNEINQSNGRTSIL